MAFDTVKKEFSRQHLWYCRIIVDGNTYTFCENISPIPAGLNVDAASMSKPQIRPSQIALTGGIGVRASVSVSFKSHQDYVRFGTLTAPKSFWPCWRAEHPGYEGAEISVYSGYVVDGVFNQVNFQKRDFILDSFSHNGSGANISAKDTLKLASNDRSKAPRKSSGQINANITDVQTSIGLIPTGIGDSEYPTSGWGRLGDEVVSFTRSSGSDVCTIVRGAYNTIADAHSINDVFQLCLYYSDTISNIDYDLLVNYAGVSASSIPKSAWDNESSLYLPGLYEALITEPTGVTSLLKELGESAPHYMFWDERTNLINLTAIKPPPLTALTLTSESNLLEGSTRITDKTDMRISTVIVKFGQFDPTKELSETSNYRQAHVRFNPNANTVYNDIEKYKVINSRWINNDNRVAAVRLAARVGRLFAVTPRQIDFSLDAKDSDVWTGAPLFINSDLIVDKVTKERYNMPVQVLSVGESRSYNYTALEYEYGVELPEDLASEDVNNKTIQLSGELDQLKDDNGNARTLRQIWQGIYGSTVASTDIVVFIFDSSCVAGSTLNSQFSVDTGSWPELATGQAITLDVRGLIVGKGADGSSVGGSASNGGPALTLAANIILVNSGIIGGGGGSGPYAIDTTSFEQRAAGGGGAGFANGLAGTGTVATGPNTTTVAAQPGTNTTGGSGAFTSSGAGEPTSARGGNGGALGQNGTSATGTTTGAGGLAGVAIDRNGFTITSSSLGDIRGTILA